ncbi:S-methyl-5-thioribose-1-phosphate isomerase [Oscillospiraceae bacterium OttesenSCG-928-F05]|nr:S-methyl-5-thioribose-1-phosphate isomerase [Oscillospiraceae bacterium OttesenSCG-928-F05]
MERADTGLAFMLKYENVAWYDGGKVAILDRRIYPAEVTFVTCHTHGEVAKAIADMVTQSAGPYTAAGMGMALAAYEARDKSEADFMAYMKDAAYTLSHARPTTVVRMRAVTDSCLTAAENARRAGTPADEAIRDCTVASLNKRYTKIGVMAEYLVDMIPQNGTVMTQCFGETIVGQMLKAARARGSALKIFCPETRPYFQGARLTASVCQDMGFDVTVITDNMPAHTMQAKKVDVFTSAADAICMDGYVINKVGTFQIALCAKALGIPYFVTGAPDRDHGDISTVTIEERDPAFVLEAMGVRTAMAGVKGYYPAFDATPPHLVSGVVTDRGILTPYDLHRYYENNTEGEYGDTTEDRFLV